MTTPTPPATDRRHRSFTATVLAQGETPADGLELAISSEAAVERVDYSTGRTYLEVLDHSPTGPNLDYVKDGCPVLLDHDLGRQVGILRDVRVDQDRRIRGRLVPGNHPDAAWVYQDMADGVRSKVSIGYWPGDTYDELPSRRGEPPVRRYRGWTLYEASSVAVPADYSVGVGRALSDSPAPTGASPSRNPMEPTTDTRPQELAALARDGGMPEKLAEWIMNGTSVAEARSEVITALRANAPAPMIGAAHDIMSSAISARAHAAPQAAPELAAFTAPESQAARTTTAQLTRDMGFAPRMGGNFLPLDVARLNSRTLTTTGSTSGAELVPKMQMGFADRLREDLLAADVGVRFMSISGGTAAFPVGTTDPTVVELAENPGSGAAASDPALATREAKPKAAVIRVALSNHIALASTPEAVTTVSGLMSRALAGHVDGRIFAGPTGGNGPVGAFFDAGVTTHGLGPTGAAISYGGLVACEKALVDARGEADDVVVITTSAVRAKLQQTQDFPSASAGRPLWADGRVLGRPAYSRSWMPSTLTKSTGSNLHGLLMYSPRRAGHLVVTWPAVEITVDRLTGADKQLTYITAALYYDVVLLHPGAVVRIADINVT